MTRTKATAAMADTAMAISEKIGPMLHGLGPELQGGVLADLVATWLSGFQGSNADAIRAEMLDALMAMVRELVPVNEAMLLERLRKGAH